ncbi:MAG TPA: peptidylprolyl isomerase [Polyangiaceae bacterium]
MQIQPNRHVTLECTLADASGKRLDEGDEPILYVHGYSTLVPGLENALQGLSVGDEKDVIVAPEDGFGERDEELVMEVERSEFPKEIKVDDEFIAESEDGEEVTMRVVEVRDEAVIVDANHPFAGLTLHYHVKVAEVREATEEEIEAAATAYEAGHDHDHEGCGHDHSHDGHSHGEGEGHSHGPEQLVTLGKKKQIVLN